MGRRVAARRGRKASTARAARRPRLRDLERAARHRAVSGRAGSQAPRLGGSRAVPGKVSGRALGDGGRADKSDRKRNEWIEISE